MGTQFGRLAGPIGMTVGAAKELEYYGKVAYYLDILNQETYDANKTNRDMNEKKREIDQLELEKIGSQIAEDEVENEDKKQTWMK